MTIRPCLNRICKITVIFVTIGRILLLELPVLVNEIIAHQRDDNCPDAGSIENLLCKPACVEAGFGLNGNLATPSIVEHVLNLAISPLLTRMVLAIARRIAIEDHTRCVSIHRMHEPIPHL